jgi:hypothetical protein
MTAPLWRNPATAAGTALPSTYAGSLHVTMPPDIVRVPAVSAPCAEMARRALPKTAVRSENALAGDPAWRAEVDPRRAWPVGIYFDDASTTCGSRVGVHLGGGGGTVTLRAYRVG